MLRRLTPAILRFGSARSWTRAVGPGPYPEIDAHRYWMPE